MATWKCVGWPSSTWTLLSCPTSLADCLPLCASHTTMLLSVTDAIICTATYQYRERLIANSRLLFRSMTPVLLTGTVGSSAIYAVDNLVLPTKYPCPDDLVLVLIILYFNQTPLSWYFKQLP